MNESHSSHARGERVPKVHISCNCDIYINVSDDVVIKDRTSWNVVLSWDGRQLRHENDFIIFLREVDIHRDVLV